MQNILFAYIGLLSSHVIREIIHHALLINQSNSQIYDALVKNNSIIRRTYCFELINVAIV